MIGTTMPLLMLTLLAGLLSDGGVHAEDSPWVSFDAQGEPRIQLYFFWTSTCPHCTEAKPFVEELAADYPWLQLHSLEVTSDRQHVARYIELAESLGEQARIVPALLFCERMLTGYDDAQTSGVYLRNALLACHRRHATTEESPPVVAEPQAPALRVPLLGTLAADELSLPLLTLVLAGLDSFNPCAFFVLLFLLSLLVHARSRRRMLLIGGTFVLFSGLIYFLFMTAWLNLFRLVGDLQLVTLAAGLLALLFGAINIKDFFRYRQGISLSIPDSAKPRLYQRMRGLLNADSHVAMLIGAATLAIVANSYELLCTAGFPMVFTRILTLREAAAGEYYAYLLLYNVVYVIPLALIVLGFVFTLGRRRLSEREGRVLKLVSGLMMFELGVVLVAAPQWLDNLYTAFLLLAVALLTTFLLVRLLPPRVA